MNQSNQPNEDLLGPWVREAGDPNVSLPPGFSAALRETLAEELTAVAPPPVGSARRLLPSWAWGATALAAVVLLLLGIAVLSRPASAMERMAENVRKARSYQYTMLVRITRDAPDGGPPRVREFTHHCFRLASGEWRSEDIQSPEWNGPGPEAVQIVPVGKPGIDVDHRKKTYRRIAGRTAGTPLSKSDDLELLGQFSAVADRELGTREIAGRPAVGFQVDLKKLNQEAGTAEIWLDPQTYLPVLVRYDFAKQGDRSFTDVLSDIRWNVELAPQLFDPTPPEGYREIPSTP